jgi:hypothetical protein
MNFSHLHSIKRWEGEFSGKCKKSVSKLAYAFFVIGSVKQHSLTYRCYKKQRRACAPFTCALYANLPHRLTVSLFSLFCNFIFIAIATFSVKRCHFFVFKMCNRRITCLTYDCTHPQNPFMMIYLLANSIIIYHIYVVNT